MEPVQGNNLTMEPRMWRMLAAVTALLLIALAAFTLLLRRYHRELGPQSGNRAGVRMVRPDGAPSLPAPVQEQVATQGIATETPPVATALVEGVGMVDVDGTAAPQGR